MKAFSTGISSDLAQSASIDFKQPKDLIREKIKENLQPNVMWNPSLTPGTEKGH